MGQAIASGLLMGAIYALVALGLGLVWGILKVINFAHGAFVMIGLYSAFWFWHLFGLSPYVSLPLTALLTGGLGILTYTLFLDRIFRRSVEREPISALVVTLALGIVLESSALILFGPDFRSVILGSDPLVLGGLTLDSLRVSSATIATVLVLIVIAFLGRTAMGRKIRAVGQDRDAARLMGIDDRWVYRLTFGAGTALAGVGGALLSPFFYATPNAGFDLGLRSYIVVTLGGIGSPLGALAGGLLVGVLENVVAFLSTQFAATAAVFVAFVLLLVFRPKGIFGREIS